MRAVWRRSIESVLPGLVVILGLVCVLGRVTHPAELEGMEGAMLDIVARLREGLPIYAAPSPEYASFVYPPLHYAIVWLSSQLFGLTFMALRIPSVFALLASLTLLFELGRRLRGDARDGLWAAALLLSGYEATGRYLDLGRVDALQLALLLGTAWVLLEGRRLRSAVLCGLLLALAFACKQTSVLVVLPAFAVLLLQRWRWVLVAGVAFAVPTLLAHLWLQAATGGWYGYYVYELPGAHPWLRASGLGYWTEDLWPDLAIPLALALATARWLRQPRIHLVLALLAGALVASWLSRLHYGGWLNVLLPVWAFSALAAAQALASLRTQIPESASSNGASRSEASGSEAGRSEASGSESSGSVASSSEASTRAHRAAGLDDLRKTRPIGAEQGEEATEPPASRLGARQVALGVALLLASAHLIWQRPRPEEAWPPDWHADAWSKIEAELERLEGPIFLPEHGTVLRRAGHRTSVHVVAIHDQLLAIPELQRQFLGDTVWPQQDRGGRVAAVAREFWRSLIRAVEGGEYRWLLLDGNLPGLDDKVPGSRWREHYQPAQLFLPERGALADAGWSKLPRLLFGRVAK